MRTNEQYATEIAEIKDFLLRYYYLSDPECLVNIRTGNPVPKKKYKYYSNPENILEVNPDIERFVIEEGRTNDFGVKFTSLKADNEYFDPFYGKVFKFKDGTIVYLCSDSICEIVNWEDREKKQTEADLYESKIRLLEEFIGEDNVI
jgi:hypothetical protein